MIISPVSSLTGVYLTSISYYSDAPRSSGNFKSVTMSGDYEMSKLLMADFDFDIRSEK